METSLLKKIKSSAEQRSRPDGTPYLSLALKDEKDIAIEQNISLREVQLQALSCEIIPERYCRNQNSISANDQIGLLQSHVAIIGQGGLGGTVTEILSRLGIGVLTLIDGDCFEESNLNRQLLCTTENLGNKKAEAGRKRVQAVNPAIEVNCVSDFLNNNNAISCIRGANVVVDCLDSISTRFILEKACKSEKIPLVSAAIGGSAGQATVVFPEDEGLRLIYGDQIDRQEKGIEKSQGTLAYAATLMAAIECVEVVSLLCKGASSLRRQLLIAEIDEKHFEKVHLPPADKKE